LSSKEYVLGRKISIETDEKNSCAGVDELVVI